MGTSEETDDVHLGTACLKNKKGKKLRIGSQTPWSRFGPIGVNSPTLWIPHMSPTVASEIS